MEEMTPGENNLLSPVQIDHLIKGYLGWVGGTALELTDMVLYDTDRFGERPEKPWYRQQVMNRFFKPRTPHTTKYLSQFYDFAETARYASGDMNERARAGDFMMVKSLFESNRDRILASKAFAQYGGAMAEYRTLLKMVREDPELSGKEKREKTEEYNKEINVLAEQAVKEFGFD
jgi:hypothetical protein